MCSVHITMIHGRSTPLPPPYTFPRVQRPSTRTPAWNKFKKIEEIEVSVQPKGDVNGDLTVDVADIASVIDVMAKSGNDASADVNKDGSVDVADIATIISFMAGKGEDPVSTRTAEAEAAEAE